MFKKLQKMKLKKRLNTGYMVVIILMIVSGLFSMIGLGVLDKSLNDFVNGSNRADTAVKMIRIDVNIAARNVREMAMNPDTSTYAGYKSKVDEKLANIEEELEAMKNTGLVDAQLEQSYEDALHAWEKSDMKLLRW